VSDSTSTSLYQSINPVFQFNSLSDDEEVFPILGQLDEWFLCEKNDFLSSILQLFGKNEFLNLSWEVKELRQYKIYRNIAVSSKELAVGEWETGKGLNPLNSKLMHNFSRSLAAQLLDLFKTQWISNFNLNQIAINERKLILSVQVIK
jgi:hypothetical protein